MAGGADAIMVENFFDAPFAKDAVPPHTLAALTRFDGVVLLTFALLRLGFDRRLGLLLRRA